MVLPKAEVAHGLADHHIPLDGQDHQGPQGDFTCKAVSCRSACFLPRLHCLSKEVARKATWGRPGVRPQGGAGLDIENWEGVQAEGLVCQGSGVTLSLVQLELWVHEGQRGQIRDRGGLEALQGVFTGECVLPGATGRVPVERCRRGRGTRVGSPPSLWSSGPSPLGNKRTWACVTLPQEPGR